MTARLVGGDPTSATKITMDHLHPLGEMTQRWIERVQLIRSPREIFACLPPILPILLPPVPLVRRGFPLEQDGHLPGIGVALTGDAGITRDLPATRRLQVLLGEGNDCSIGSRHTNVDEALSSLKCARVRAADVPDSRADFVN